MQSNISSSNIHIFPLAKNRPLDRSARLFYENNVANLTRQLIDSDGFIVMPKEVIDKPLRLSDNKIVFNGTEPLCFNIYGYFFEIDGQSILFEMEQPDKYQKEEYSTLYAVIQVDTNTREIVGQDESDPNGDDRYYGLAITETEDIEAEENKKVAILPLFEFKLVLNNGTRDIESRFITNSFKKLKLESIFMSVYKIDGRRSTYPSIYDSLTS